MKPNFAPQIVSQPLLTCTLSYAFYEENKLCAVASPAKRNIKRCNIFPKTRKKKPARDCKQNAAKQIYAQIQTAVSYQNWGPLNRFYGSYPPTLLCSPTTFQNASTEALSAGSTFLSHRSRSRNGALLHHNRGNFSNHHVKANKQ